MGLGRLSMGLPLISIKISQGLAWKRPPPSRCFVLDACQAEHCDLRPPSFCSPAMAVHSQRIFRWPGYSFGPFPTPQQGW